MSEKMKNPKGTRDILPKEKILKNKIIDLLENTFGKYGFEPLETPAIQKYDVLSSKYAGGSEILEETYSFKDRGERKLGLRYDLTVPLCRVIASNKQIPKPFKRYEIGRAWRDGPVKKGRLREFWQCDVDTIGSDNMLADAEFMKIVEEVLEELDLNFTIKFNNRKILDGILESVGVSKVIWNSFLQSIDKLEKIGKDGVKKELMNKGFESETIDNVFDIILKKGKDEELLNKLEEINNEHMRQGLREIKELRNYAKLLGIDENNMKWDISLSRGLDYYTSTVYETFLEDSEVTSAIAAGGRYDDIIGSFMEEEERIPAVGLSFGIDAIIEAIETSEKTSVKVLVVPIGQKKEAIKAVSELRKMDINADIDLMERGISKNLDYANSKGIPYTI
ncbi:MAG: histidine--tRNA ligase, partial [Candidatus Aenigmatarchaeota archaeon]